MILGRLCIISICISTVSVARQRFRDEPPGAGRNGGPRNQRYGKGSPTATGGDKDATNLVSNIRRMTMTELKQQQILYQKKSAYYTVREKQNQKLRKEYKGYLRLIQKEIWARLLRQAAREMSNSGKPRMGSEQPNNLGKANPEERLPYGNSGNRANRRTPQKTASYPGTARTNTANQRYKYNRGKVNQGDRRVYNDSPGNRGNRKPAQQTVTYPEPARNPPNQRYKRDSSYPVLAGGNTGSWPEEGEGQGMTTESSAPGSEEADKRMAKRDFNPLPKGDRKKRETSTPESARLNKRKGGADRINKVKPGKKEKRETGTPESARLNKRKGGADRINKVKPGKREKRETGTPEPARLNKRKGGADRINKVKPGKKEKRETGTPEPARLNKRKFAANRIDKVKPGKKD